MSRLVKCTFCFEKEQLEELKELAAKSGIPQVVYMREALERLLKRYRHITTMDPFTVDEVKYSLAGIRAIPEEDWMKYEADKKAERDRRLQHYFGKKPRQRKKRSY